jgi:opacity protein-like surface antigen
MPSWMQNRTWHLVISTSGGIAKSSDAGKSQNFPIQNPATDEFYTYTANRASQTSALFGGFLGIEWLLRPNWSLQTGIEYNQPSAFSGQGTLAQGADIASQNSYTYQYNISNQQVLAEAKLLYNFKERLHPYVLLGLGAAFNRANGFGTNVPPFLAFTRQYSNNTQSSFSYAAGLGVDADITAHARIGVGYRFTDLGKVALGSATIDNTNVSGTLSQSHLYTNEVLAQLTWVI